MNAYAIRRIPTSENGYKAREMLKDFAGWTYKTHGRGHRFGNSGQWMPGQGGWCQELPLKYAAWMTLYGYPKANNGAWTEKDYWEYKGMRNGKPVIRQYHPA